MCPVLVQVPPGHWNFCVRYSPHALTCQWWSSLWNCKDCSSHKRHMRSRTVGRPGRCSQLLIFQSRGTIVVATLLSCCATGTGNQLYISEVGTQSSLSPWRLQCWPQMCERTSENASRHHFSVASELPLKLAVSQRCCRLKPVRSKSVMKPHA